MPRKLSLEEANADREVMRIIEAHAKYINTWSTEHDKAPENAVTLRNYWESFVGCAPILHFNFRSEEWGWIRRTIRLELDPFGDEGGSAILTAEFSNWPAGGERLVLSWILMEFDTIPTVIYSEGHFHHLPDGKARTDADMDEVEAL